MPGSRKNGNAVTVGLYVRHPTVRAKLGNGHPVWTLRPDEVHIATLTPLAADMADAAAWLAEQLEKMMGEGRISTLVLDDASKLIGLYAKVGFELFQLTGELAGETGIKAASLGQLGEGGFENMMRNQIRTLDLILGQIATAVAGIKTKEKMVEGGIVDKNGDLNPVLAYLAGHMRAAKRMLEEMAANVAWHKQRESGGDDLADRVWGSSE